MRKQVNRLSIITAEEMMMNPVSGFFLTYSRDSKLLKCIYWDCYGFCLWQKRLEKGKYPWPDMEEEAREITIHELNMFLDGIDFWHAHQAIHYEGMV